MHARVQQRQQSLDHYRTATRIAFGQHIRPVLWEDAADHDRDQRFVHEHLKDVLNGTYKSVELVFIDHTIHPPRIPTGLDAVIVTDNATQRRKDIIGMYPKTCYQLPTHGFGAIAEQVRTVIHGGTGK